MSQQPDPRAEIAATFARMRAEIDEAERRALAFLGTSVDLATPLAPMAGQKWLSDWGPLSEAEKMLKCSRATALRKIELHGLGHVVDRRWKIDLNRVRAYLAKQPFPPLTGAN